MFLFERQSSRHLVTQKTLLLFAAIHTEIDERFNRTLPRRNFSRQLMAHRFDTAQIGNDCRDIIIR